MGKHMAVALQVNFALWAMLVCATLDVVEHLLE
jgi:hypothetical protein